MTASDPAFELEVASWNLAGLDEFAPGSRTEAAVQDLLLGARIEALAQGRAPRPAPDVLLLQEVTRTTYHAVLKPHLRAAGYQLLPEEVPDRSYYELIAVRAPWAVRRHESEPLWKTQYGRWLHHAEIERQGETMTVWTAHLDSGPEPGTSARRRAQALDIAQRLESRSLFAGDTNLRDREWVEVKERVDVRDAWTEGGEQPDARFTWASGPRKARFDRAWLSSDLELLDFELIGDAEVTGLGVPPSDHRGLRFRVGGHAG